MNDFNAASHNYRLLIDLEHQKEGAIYECDGAAFIVIPDKNPAHRHSIEIGYVQYFIAKGIIEIVDHDFDYYEQWVIDNEK